jgi:deoxyribodipyrimidine photo-lyase
MIHPTRIQYLNSRPAQEGNFVLYWMQASQRTEWNHALEFAARSANKQKMPLLVLFVLTENFPEANLRHYTFLLEGLREVKVGLERRGIPFIVLPGSPEKETMKVARQASMVVTDRGYLRVQKKWRQHVAENVSCPVVQVESDVVVPVETAYPKEAYSAAVLRRKIQKFLPEYLVPLSENPIPHKSGVGAGLPRPHNKHGHVGLTIPFSGLDLEQGPKEILSSFSIDRSVPPVNGFPGGTAQAKKFLDEFIRNKLRDYSEDRNDPSLDLGSRMSAYLHFGQISPLYISTKIREAVKVPPRARQAYLEELIVRRELAMNFIHYNPAYDSFESIPGWSKETLQKHLRDERESLYSPEELERGRTHDPYWNAAQREMVVTGRMHNYLRMYWGKKILEWSPSPEEAFRVALYLNNKYELDGRDPNGFAGVAWCFGKHDRPWGERRIFGKVRYMNEAGLRRKFNMDAYLKRIEAL